MDRLQKWDRRYLNLAEHISLWSKDPSSKIGAVIVSPIAGRVISLGFNGFPTKIEDSVDRLADRDQKYPMIIHAEQNALLFSGREARDCHLYVHGKPVCARCAILAIQAGIKRVIATRPSETDQIWDKEGRLALKYFEEASVEFIDAVAIPNSSEA